MKYTFFRVLTLGYNNLKHNIMDAVNRPELASFGGNNYPFNNGGRRDSGDGLAAAALAIGIVNSKDCHNRHDHDCRKDGDLFTLNAIGNLKDTIHNAKDSLDERIDSTRDSLSSRIDSTKDQVVSEGRHIDRELCDLKGDVLKGFYDTRGDIKDASYASAIQAERNTNEIKNQAQLNHLDNDRKFDGLSREGERNTALILAKLNQSELDRLRDDLHNERRGRDSREIEINNTNINTNVLAAIQSVRNESDRKFDALFSSFNQLNRNTQDIINFGTMAASGNQANQQTNVK